MIKKKILRNPKGVSLKKYMKRMYLPEREAGPAPKIVAYEDHDMLEPQEPPTMDISQKRKPTWVREIIQ